VTRIATKDGKNFCMKIIPIKEEEPEKKERANNEIEALKRLKNHTNVIQFEEAFQVFQNNQEYICIVMELFGKQDLFHLFKKKQTFREKAIRKIIEQLVDALLFCHQQGVVHRDIKLQNILIEPSSHHIKLIDFGLSAVCESQEEMEKLDRLCGSPFYVPPELYNGVYDGKISDVWSIGILVFVLVKGKFPFDNKERDLSKLVESVCNDNFEMPNCSKELADLLSKMLQKDPKKRIKLHELKNHEWFVSKEKRGSPEICKSEKIISFKPHHHKTTSGSHIHADFSPNSIF